MTNSSVSAKKPSATLNVLVVDDEDLIRWSLRRGLSQRGHKVVEARDGKTALASLTTDSNGFEAILLDYRLPDRQDLTLLQDIRRLSPASAVYMMTAFGDTAMRAHALASGVRAVVDKPFRVNDFIAIVESTERP